MVARDSIRALIKQTGFGFFFVYILSQGSTNKIERDPFGTVDAPREASGKEKKFDSKTGGDYKNNDLHYSLRPSIRWDQLGFGCRPATRE